MIKPEIEPVFRLEIAGRSFTNWTELEFQESLDGFSVVAFTAPFEPTMKAFRDTFRPFTYPRVRLMIDGELQFTGHLMSVEPASDGSSNSVKVQCVALPAVLCDCPVPASYDKKSFSGLHLLSIAQSLCAIYGFTAKFADAQSGTIGGEFGAAAASKAELAKALASLENRFDKVRIEKDDLIHEFLCKLVQQRGLIMSNDQDGNLVFLKSASTGHPVVALDEEKGAPLISVAVQFSPQEYFSEVSVVVAPKRGKPGGTFTETNPHFTGLFRPTTFKCDDIKRSDGPNAARAKLARMFGNAVSWDVELPTIRDQHGELLKPNTTVIMKAPSVMVYGRHEFLVRTVAKRQSVDSTTAKLGLVLPGSFSGDVPQVLPWNEAL